MIVVALLCGALAACGAQDVVARDSPASTRAPGGAATAPAAPGPGPGSGSGGMMRGGMMGGGMMGSGMGGDPMRTAMQLLMAHQAVRRSVDQTPDGVRCAPLAG